MLNSLPVLVRCSDSKHGAWGHIPVAVPKVDLLSIIGVIKHLSFLLLIVFPALGSQFVVWSLLHQPIWEEWLYGGKIFLIERYRGNKFHSLWKRASKMETSFIGFVSECSRNPELFYGYYAFWLLYLRFVHEDWNAFFAEYVNKRWDVSLIRAWFGGWRK